MRPLASLISVQASAPNSRCSTLRAAADTGAAGAAAAAGPAGPAAEAADVAGSACEGSGAMSAVAATGAGTAAGTAAERTGAALETRLTGLSSTSLLSHRYSPTGAATNTSTPSS